MKEKLTISKGSMLIILLSVYFVVRLAVKNGVRQALSFSNNSRKKDMKKLLDYLIDKD